jgi:hypothetical protein
MGANAVTTVPVYTAGEVLTAADMNITNSGIPVFASTVERDAAFGGTGEKTLAEGQFAYLETGNVTQYYDGASWQSVGVAPGLVYITGASFSSATTISMAAGVFTSTYKTYQVIFQITSGSDCQISARVNNAGTPRTSANYVGSSVRNSYFTDVEYSKSNSTTSLNLCANASGNGWTANLNMTVFDPMNASTRTRFYAAGVGANNSNEVGPVYAGGLYSTTAEANDGLTWIAGAAVTGFYRVYGLSES